MHSFLQCKINERIFELGGLDTLLNPYARLDARLHLVLDPEVGSSLDDEYSVTRVATKVAWYIPCVMWSRVGESGRSYGGRLEWVVGWVCGGLRHEVPDVVSGKEVPDRGVTAPSRPDPRSRLEEGAWRLGFPPSG